MGKFRNWLGKVFYGRYGRDELSMVMLAAGALLSVLASLPHMKLLLLAAYALLIGALYRCFSKNIPRRRQEQAAYLEQKKRVQKFFRIQYRRFRERKTHIYYKCPGCGTYNRIPRGHGRILITCPKCRRQFEGR